jgi:hypothetical protein
MFLCKHSGNKRQVLCQSIAEFVLQESNIGECSFILYTPKNLQGVKQTHTKISKKPKISKEQKSAKNKNQQRTKIQQITKNQHT